MITMLLHPDSAFEKSVYGRMDRPTDQRTDKASYRDAWTHLKNKTDKGGQTERQNDYYCLGEPKAKPKVRTNQIMMERRIDRETK